MSTVLAFGFVPGGRFSLSDYRSFDPAIPHQFIHVAFAASAASSTLWPTRKAARSAPRPSHKAATSTPQYFSEVLPVVAAASSVPRPSHKAAKSAPRSSHKTLGCLCRSCYLTITPVSPQSLLCSTAPRPSWKVTSIVVVATSTLAIRPPHKATISTTPAPRPPHKIISVSVNATTTPQRLHNTHSSAVVASPTPASRPLQKAVITTTTSATRYTVCSTPPEHQFRCSIVISMAGSHGYRRRASRR
ncbi:hypothetical protein ACLOJK_037474 [Asimina triloba]